MIVLTTLTVQASLVTFNRVRIPTRCRIKVKGIIPLDLNGLTQLRPSDTLSGGNSLTFFIGRRFNIGISNIEPSA